MNGNVINKLENGNSFENCKMESHKTEKKDDRYEAVTSDINVFDKILERVGGLGRYQWLHIVILFASQISPGMYNMANGLFAAVPGYRCVPDAANNATYSFIPDIVNYTGNPTYNISATTPLSYQTFPEEPCRIDNYTFDTSSAHTNENMLQCPNWQYDTELFGTTIVSEWGFVCSREWLASLSQTTYMIGFLVGGLWVGWLSDKYGRKTAWMMNVLIMIVTGMTASFMYSYWAFIALRALSAMGSTATLISAYVLLTENLGPKHRLNFAMWFHMTFALGYMMMAVVGYFLKNFRHLAIFMAFIPILNIPLFWVIDESARWLLAEGRIPEARVVITRIARINKSEFPIDLLNSESEQLLKAEREKMNNRNVSVIELVRTPNMRFKIIIISYGWFLCTLLYYGLSLGASSFVGGPFLNLFLSGLVEFPGILLSAYLLNKIGRKLVYGGSLIFSSVCCLIMASIPQQYPIAITVFSLLGRFAITMSFATVFIYTAELFPTVVRTIAVGTGSMFARVAGILAPSIALLGNYWAVLPSLVFGVLTLIGGVLSFLLPETLNQRLPELLEDGERFGKGSYKRMCLFPNNSKIYNMKPKAEHAIALHD